MSGGVCKRGGAQVSLSAVVHLSGECEYMYAIGCSAAVRVEY